MVLHLDVLHTEISRYNDASLHLALPPPPQIYTLASEII